MTHVLSYRVYMVHSWVHNVSELSNMLCLHNSELVSCMKWDPDDPQYIFISEQIYMFDESYKEFIRLVNLSKNTNTPRVFIMTSFECLLPDLNLFDYAICFDTRIKNERIGRIPPLYFYSNSIFNLHNNLTVQEAHDLYHAKEYCNFMYSNKHAHIMRDQLFFQLNKYKKVDSTGKHLHNTDILPEDTHPDWHLESIQVKKRYRFSIACENASLNGYTSEKILTSFQAHSIPIYWGNPDIAKEFNSAALINVSSFTNLDDVLEEVKRIDTNENEWCRVVTQPYITKKQLNKASLDMQKYQNFMNNIFTQQITNAIRRPIGYWPDIYIQWIRNNLFNH